MNGKCEVCGEMCGNHFISIKNKYSDTFSFVWTCQHCEKAIRWILKRIDDTNNTEERLYSTIPSEIWGNKGNNK